MRRFSLLVAAVFISLAASHAKSARATDNFPPAVQQNLGLAQPPDCSLCHLDGVTGRGTVNTGFGQNMRARGLVPLDTASLQAALEIMTQERVDSDGDCVPDVDELKAGTNPNTPDGAGTCAATTPTSGGGERAPRYGCGAHIATARVGNAGATSPFLVFSLALVAVLRRRRTTEVRTP